MTIQLSDGEFVAALARVRSIADELGRQRDTTERRVGVLLDGGWSGAAATAYAERWAEWRTGADAVLAALARLTVAMDEARRGLLATDDRVAGGLSPLLAAAAAGARA